MVSNDISTTSTVRNVYIIDDKGIIRTILIYPMNVGRFVPEIIRIIQALQIVDCSNGSTPANWMLGNPVIEQSPKTFGELQKRVEYINENKNGINWYLSFKNLSKECEEKVNLNQNEPKTLE